MVSTSDDMKGLGVRLGSALSSDPRLVLLRGSVGAGKTTLSRGIIQGWSSAVSEGEEGMDVVSPSYLLDITYDRSTEAGDIERLHHVDLYRLKGDEDLTRLMGDNVFRQGVWLVEWPERMEQGNGMGVDLNGIEKVEVEIRIEEKDEDVVEEEEGGGVGDRDVLIDLSGLEMGDRERRVVIRSDAGWKVPL